MEREHAVDRFTTFADAVVAIAITLLALPLIDLARESAGTAADWWSDSWNALLGFLISFAVVGRLWWAHHRVTSHLLRLNRPFVLSTFVWLLTIVLVSVATAVTTSTSTGRAGRWAFLIYVGVMIASGVALLVQAVLVLRDPTLTDGRDDDATRHVIGLGVTLFGFVLALVIGLLLPDIGYLAFLVLALTGRLDGPVESVLLRRARRRAGEQRRGVR